MTEMYEVGGMRVPSFLYFSLLVTLVCLFGRTYCKPSRLPRYSMAKDVHLDIHMAPYGQICLDSRWPISAFVETEGK